MFGHFVEETKREILAMHKSSGKHVHEKYTPSNPTFM